MKNQGLVMDDGELRQRTINNEKTIENLRTQTQNNIAGFIAKKLFIFYFLQFYLKNVRYVCQKYVQMKN